MKGMKNLRLVSSNGWMLVILSWFGTMAVSGCNQSQMEPSNSALVTSCAFDSSIWGRTYPVITAKTSGSWHPDTMMFKKIPMSERNEYEHYWEFSETLNLKLWMYSYSPPYPEYPPDHEGLVTGQPAGIGSGKYELRNDTLLIYANDSMQFRVLQCSDTTFTVARIDSQE
jgi:hypothetical protein